MIRKWVEKVSIIIFDFLCYSEIKIEWLYLGWWWFFNLF